jgi:hypothetical protein
MAAPCQSFGDIAAVLPASKHSHHRVKGGHNARLCLLSPMQRCVTIATRTAPATAHKILDLPQAKNLLLSLPLSSSHSWPIPSSDRLVPSFYHPSQPMASESARARVKRGEMRDSALASNSRRAPALLCAAMREGARAPCHRTSFSPRRRFSRKALRAGSGRRCLYDTRHKGFQRHVAVNLLV